jgi:hypothetical protein
MNANGNMVTLSVDGEDYYFESLQIAVANRIETTALIGGGCIRVRSGGSPMTIVLKGRIKQSRIFEYENLLKSLSGGVISNLSINEQSHSGFTLLSGKITSGEKQAAAVCEIILTEADE